MEVRVTRLRLAMCSICAAVTINCLCIGCNDVRSGPVQPEPLSVYVDQNDGDLISGIRAATFALNDPKYYNLELDATGAPIEISLGHVAITDAEMEQITEFESLRVLYLSDAALSDTGLAHLSNLSELETLGLSGNPITDDGIRGIGALPNLTHLNLSHTPITDASVELLSSIETLRELRIYETQLTPSGIAAIRAALPDCRVKDLL